MRQPLRAVLFDLDGTLVDTVNLIVTSLQHTWRTCLGESLDQTVARSWIGRTLVDVFSPYGDELSEQMRQTYVSFNVEALPKLQTSVDGIGDVLAAVDEAGLLKGIATSKRRETAQLSLDVAEIDGIELFATLVDTAEHKPSPAPLLLAAAKMGTNPHEMVYVGDAVVDVLAAKNARMRSIAVTWGAGLPDALEAASPDALVHTPAELKAAIQSMV